MQPATYRWTDGTGLTGTGSFRRLRLHRSPVVVCSTHHEPQGNLYVDSITADLPVQRTCVLWLSFVLGHHCRSLRNGRLPRVETRLTREGETFRHSRLRRCYVSRLRCALSRCGVEYERLLDRSRLRFNQRDCFRTCDKRYRDCYALRIEHQTVV